MKKILMKILDYDIIEPKVSPKKAKNISLYKESKIAKHTTINGRGLINRLLRGKKNA